jgi:hypothetical protein
MGATRDIKNIESKTPDGCVKAARKSTLAFRKKYGVAVKEIDGDEKFDEIIEMLKLKNGVKRQRVE